MADLGTIGTAAGGTTVLLRPTAQHTSLAIARTGSGGASQPFTLH